MRKLSKAALLCLVLATQACTLTLPTGLTTTGTKPPGQGGNGTITGQEDCNALFFKFDLNGDKELSEEEYVTGRLSNVKKDAPGTGTASGTTTGAQEPAKAPTQEERRQVLDVRTLEDDIRAGFKAMDADKNGRVSRDEFLTNCEGTAKDKAVPPTPPDGGVVPGKPPVIGNDDCKSVFVKYDFDHNGEWNRKEYDAWSNANPLPMAPAVCMPYPYGTDGNTGSGLISNEAGTQLISNNATVGPTVTGEEPCYPAGPVRAPFEKYDADGSGMISAEEYCAYSDGGGTIQPTPPPPNWDCKSTFLRADANQDGRVDLEEYQRADYSAPPPDGMARPAVMPSDEELIRRFMSMDGNGDKVLTPDEFCGGGPEPDPDPGVPDDCEGMERDLNRDGLVKWEEFFVPPPPNADVDYAAYKDGQYREFKSKDRDGNGQLDKNEVCGYEVTEPWPTNDKCTAEFKSFDRDGSGKLSFDEYAGGRYGQIQFIQAPSQEEAAKFIYDFKARARNFDVDGDEQLSLEEFAKGCYQ